ncbi:RraA family protein [Paenalcaligenes niemegkensis]|uniref:RraA family protein n=1 Tax=Paenalcaligenes niemegkensis TaxID=2895469 RepID=UPI001EE997FD|nr:RraA family protein [Paenalcaligenes niemegkensis]MCQ9616041.1 RraA family protein [Paenalcaligenes niemegkensis]
MAIGFKVRTQIPRVSIPNIERFRTLPVANVSDAMSRLLGGGCTLRPMHKNGILAGPALTVKTRPGDNLMLHKAIDIAQPGDVIVVDAGGDLTNSLMGELMLEHAIMRGIAGFVLNGAIRDAQAIYDRNLPLYALGITHRGPYRTGPGEIGYPIAIEGMVIQPGALILGDLDGVVCINHEQLDEVHQGASAKHAAETKQMEITKNQTIDRSWVDKELIKLGCVFEN